MADSSKTEKATPKKRRDERKKGHIFFSNDAVSVVVLLACFWTIKLLGPGAAEELASFFYFCMHTATDSTGLPGTELVIRLLVTFAKTAGPLLAVSVVAGLAATFFQTRFLVSGESIRPKLSHLNPIQGFTRLFSLRSVIEALKGLLKILLLPKDPNDDKNVILEIRGGVGGEESALFAHSLFRMYQMYAASKGWTMEILNYNETELGGVKEADCIINGSGAYSRLKFESGVHRVQRVPETESGGRVHTSTATVAVLPEMEEVDVEIRPEDIEMQVFRSSGAGGQHINKTSSAVRLIHKPSGIVVACQEERSQVQNREKCMKMLASKLYEIEQTRIETEHSDQRRSQVGTGMRNERIRTYNFPQGRVTDHRIGLTLYKIDAFMDGDLDEMIDALVTADQAEKLQRSEKA